MGGNGSGRYRIRPYLGQLLRVGVNEFRQATEGARYVLSWSSGSTINVAAESSGFRLSFAIDGQPVTQYLRTEQLPCNYGGHRALIVCPRCNRRARYLYLRWRQFMCRPCTRVRYWTQTASPDARMVYGIRRLQKRLAPEIDPDDYVIDYIPKRPPGMRRRTYQRLKQRALALIDARDAYLEPGLLRLIARLGAPLEGLFD